MPDITMCEGKGCKQKLKCNRFTTCPSDRRQSWFAESPNTSPTKCDQFWSNKGRDINFNRMAEGMGVS